MNYDQILKELKEKISKMTESEKLQRLHELKIQKIKITKNKNKLKCVEEQTDDGLYIASISPNQKECIELEDKEIELYKESNLIKLSMGKKL